MSTTIRSRVISEEHFRLLIDNALDIITVIDGDGTILYESPSVERVLGFRPEELVGRNAFELIHPDDLVHVFEVYLPALNVPGTSASVEFRFKTASGGWVYLESIGTNLLEHPSLGAIVINSRDVSERKRAELALQEANETLERRVEERTRELARAVERLESARATQKRFIADASHDLRTPLTVINGELDLLSTDESLAADVREALERMKDEVMTLGQLTRDLLMLARLDADPAGGSEPVPVAETIRGELESLTPMARDRRLRWEARLDEGIVVQGDRTALARALRNVLENAVIYAFADSDIAIGLTADEEGIEVTVENRGAGIAPQEIDRVFDRFYRADTTRGARRPGLGLSIVRSVIAAHGGTVAISSTPGDSTRVTIRLPRPSLPQSIRATP